MIKFGDNNNNVNEGLGTKVKKKKPTLEVGGWREVFFNWC